MFEEHFESQPMPNWAFEKKYKQVGESGSGAAGVVVKVVKRDDPNGEVFAAKKTRRGFNNSVIPEIKVVKHLDHPRLPKNYEVFEGYGE